MANDVIAEDQAYQELAAAAYARGLSAGSRGLSDSRPPSTLIMSRSRSNGSLGSSLSGSFLSKSTGAAMAPYRGPRGEVATQTAFVQTEPLLPHVCARCAMPPRPAPRRANELPSAAGGGFPRLQRMGTSMRRKRKVTLNSSKCVNSQFAETPRSSQMMAVLLALEHINYRGDGCCAYHIGCANLALILQEMCSSECMPDFSPATGWQCGSCMSLNGRAVPREDSQGEASSADEAPQALIECEVCATYTPAPLPLLRVPEGAVTESLPSASSSHRSDYLLQECGSAPQSQMRGLHQPTPQNGAARPLLYQLEEAAACQMPISSCSDAKGGKNLIQLPAAMGASNMASASTELPIGSAVPSVSNTSRSARSLDCEGSDTSG